MTKLTYTLCLCFALSIMQSEAQILKGFGKKLEKKIEERIDRKADRQVDKVLDKADKKTDEPINDIIDGKASSSGEKAKPAKSAAPSAATAPTNGERQTLSDGVLMMPGNSCSDFIWFKSGAMMEFSTSDGKGKVLNQSRMDIVSVEQEGPVTVATAKTSDEEGREFTMQFKCAGDRMYMDFGSMMKEAMAQAGGTGADQANMQQALDNTEIDFSDGFLSFPKNMHAGQELEDVSVSIVNNSSPGVSMEMLSSLEERKVEAEETISTPAGDFKCMKISGVRKTSMKVMGMNKNMKPIIEHMWFAPGIGVIKQDTYDEKGKLGTSMVLTAYKL